MKKFFNDHKKLIIFSLFVLVFITACTNVRNADGTIDANKLIYLNNAKHGTTDFGACVKEGWFNVFVWPVAQLINWVASFSDAGVGIIVATILLNVLIFGVSIKQQVASQKMQMIQPEMKKIQEKYAGKNDTNSKMRQGQEVQKLYNKYDISPLGSMVIMFIQLPVIFAVYQAVMRADTVNSGKFIGVSLSQTPMEGFSAVSIPVIIIFALMIIFQFLSFKIPQILQKRREDKAGKKRKEYAKPKEKKGGMQNSMNSMMYMSLGMVVLFSINWPLGMTFYWLVNSFTRVIQNIVIDKYFIKDL